MMLFGPLSNLVEISARVSHRTRGLRGMRFLLPNRHDSTDIRRTQERLADTVETMNNNRMNNGDGMVNGREEQ